MTDVGFTVIGGYLGAGKTTLLNRLLTGNEGRRLALLINDFGDINIDASLIERQTDSQINLTNGCICCGLAAGFDEAIETLLTTVPAPDHIVVEASGVADVATLADYGRRPGLRPEGIIVVADAETVRLKARDKYVAGTVRRQLAAADLIVLNKTDLVSAAELDATRTWLAAHAPDARVVTASYCDLPAGLLLGIEPGLTMRSARGESCRGDVEAYSQPEQPNPPPQHVQHESYRSWSWRYAEPLAEDRVMAFINGLPESVLRAKGYFLIGPGRSLFQQVGRRWTLTALAPGSPASTGASELVLIGLERQLDIARLEALAGELACQDQSPAAAI